MTRTFHRALFTLLLIAAVTPSAFASHSWNNYHWNKPGTSVSLVLGDNTSGVWDTYLINAESDWDQSTVLTLSLGAGGAVPKTCRPTGGRIEVCNARYGSNGWLGLAQIWLSGGHISQGTAKMNDSYFMYESEKRHVMCQEVGHTFGLGHTSENGTSQGTCMDYYNNTSNSDMTSTSPNAHDYDQLATTYSHAGAVAPGILSDSIASGFGYLSFTGGVDTMGEEIFRTADGRGRVYRLDLGTNDKGEDIEVLTHVYMAGENNSFIDDEKVERPWIREQN